VNGILVNCDNDTDVLENLLKYIDNYVQQLTVKQTNLYARQFIIAYPKLKPRLRVWDWVHAKENKIKTFTGLLLQQEIM